LANRFLSVRLEIKHDEDAENEEKGEMRSYSRMAVGGDAVSVLNGEANRFPYSFCIRGREAKVA